MSCGRLSRPPRPRPRLASGGDDPETTRRSCIGARPVEPDVLARFAGAIPFEAESVGLIRGRTGVGGYATWTGFTAARVVHLHAFAGRGRRPADCCGTRFHLPRNLGTPRCQIIIDVEINAGKLHPAHFADEIG